MIEPSWLAQAHLFVAVADAKSFSRAAEALSIPASVLSRRIRELEAKFDLKLLNRTTRKVELTESGSLFLTRVRHLLDEVQLVYDDVRAERRSPSGTVRIAMPSSVAARLAVPWIMEFIRAYPRISIEIDTAPDHVDPIADNFDICLHDRSVHSSALIVRQLASFKRSLFASPAYLASRGAPQRPEDLAAHDCICVGKRGPGRSVWALTRGEEEVTVPVGGCVASSDPDLGWALAIEGAGIAAVVTNSFVLDAAEGRLVPVLPGWSYQPLILTASMPNRLPPARTRVFLEFLASKIDAEKLRSDAIAKD